MNGAECIIQVLKQHGATHWFGYPGGMVTYIMDAIAKDAEVESHLLYHEQAAAFAACGYSQVTNDLSVVFATSGPGATNLITGICNAWFDSIPVVFITGQVNTYESKGALSVRQKGFQETEIVEIVKSVTKYTAQVQRIEELEETLLRACEVAKTGRFGPVLIDVPMNISREMVHSPSTMPRPQVRDTKALEVALLCRDFLIQAKRPCVLLGNGMHLCAQSEIVALASKLKCPVVTSMPAVDLFPNDYENFYGFIGAYGSRVANTIIEKSDAILALGTRIDTRQTGAEVKYFATNAHLMRIDIDGAELSNTIKQDKETSCLCDVVALVKELVKLHSLTGNVTEWNSCCKQIQGLLKDVDAQKETDVVAHISDFVSNRAVVTTDVGQNQLWVAQAFHVKQSQRILFSAGLGAMGYSLPAAIGACIANQKKITYSFNGDGGLQMNIQELQMVFREKLPIKIIVLNNQSLGMIRHFQEMYFDANYVMTTEESGYTAPNFAKIAVAYGIEAMDYAGPDDDVVLSEILAHNRPALINLKLSNETITKPKSVYNLPLSQQEPPLPQSVLNEIEKILDENKTY